MRASSLAHPSAALQARGRHQEAERHHFSARQAQEEHRAEDRLHDHFHRGEMLRQPRMRFEHLENEPMRPEHQDTTADEVAESRGRLRGISYETSAELSHVIVNR